jgi:hypothetical protein
MKAKVYDFAAFREAMAKKQHAREVANAVVEVVHRAGFDLVPRAETRAPRARSRKCCILCGKSGHNRQTCKNPTPERLERLNEKLRREDERFAARLARAEALAAESEADHG